MVERGVVHCKLGSRQERKGKKGFQAGRVCKGVRNLILVPWKGKGYLAVPAYKGNLQGEASSLYLPTRAAERKHRGL
eukprot:1147703-Pelagomonas_calceolata.AAC.1